MTDDISDCTDLLAANYGACEVTPATRRLWG
jgi:hypothetical protein